MNHFNEIQINCIRECIANGFLSRQTARDSFGIGQFNGTTVKALIDNECFLDDTDRKNSYPLIVIPNQNSEVIKNIDIIGKYVSFFDPKSKKGTNSMFTKTKVLGLSMKKKYVYFKWSTGSNYYSPVSCITKLHEPEIN